VVEVLVGKERELHSHDFGHNHHHYIVIVAGEDKGKDLHHRNGSGVVGKVSYRHSHLLRRATVGEGDHRRKVVVEATDSRDSVGLPK